MNHLLIYLIYFCLTFTVLACDSEKKPVFEQTEIDSSFDMNVDEDSLDAMMSAGVEPRPDMIPEFARGGILTGITTRGHWDGQAANARFDGATCMALSPDQPFIWVSDTFNGTIRRISIETGEVMTVIGKPYELAVIDGSSEEARFESPRGCAVSSAQTLLGSALWVADSSTIRKITLDETGAHVLRVDTVAGQAGQRGHVDGLGTEIRLGYLIHDLLVNPQGNALYLADRSNDRIRVLTLDGDQVRISAVAGGANTVRDGSGSEAGFDGPGGLAWHGNALLVADTFSGRLREINLETQEVTTLARNLNDPQGVASFGDLAWVAGFDGMIWQISLIDGESERLLGNPNEVYAVDGYGSEIRLGGSFASIRYDASHEQLLYMDMNSNALRSLQRTPLKAQTLAGPTFVGIARDGSLAKARFGSMLDVVGAPLEDERLMRWFVSDPEHYAVREINEKSSIVSTVIGGEYDGVIRDGALDQATISAPAGLAYDPQTQSLYVADYDAHVVRRIDLEAGMVQTIAGIAGEPGSDDGILGQGRLDTPLGLALSPQAILYIVDGGTGVLRALDLSTGTLSTRSEASAGLWDVVVSPEGVIYGSDELDATLLRLAQNSGEWDVVAGTPEQTGPADGLNGLLARPMGLSLGENGQILIADADNFAIRSYDPSTGLLATFVGSATRPGGQGNYEAYPWNELSVLDPMAIAWDPWQGRGGVIADTALYTLWSVDAQEREPPIPPPPLSELPLGDFEVELGTGIEALIPLEAGDHMTLHRGCQGAQHIWVSLQVTEMEQEPISFELSLRDQEQVLTRLYLEGEPWLYLNHGTYDQVGLSFVVFDPEEALGRPLVLGVEVKTADGRVGYGWREVQIEWGADSCGG